MLASQQFIVVSFHVGLHSVSARFPLGTCNPCRDNWTGWGNSGIRFVIIIRRFLPLGLPHRAGWGHLIVWLIRGVICSCHSTNGARRRYGVISIIVTVRSLYLFFLRHPNRAGSRYFILFIVLHFRAWSWPGLWLGFQIRFNNRRLSTGDVARRLRRGNSLFRIKEGCLRLITSLGNIRLLI